MKVHRIITPVRQINKSCGTVSTPSSGPTFCRDTCETHLHNLNYTLTVSDIAAGYIMLPVPADPAYRMECMLYVADGPVLLPPDSYEIVDRPVPGIFNRLEWLGRSLHGLLEPGEQIRFQYIRLN